MEEMIGDLERVPCAVEYAASHCEMDLDAVICRPAIAIVDELAHTNVPARTIETLSDVLHY